MTYNNRILILSIVGAQMLNGTDIARKLNDRSAVKNEKSDEMFAKEFDLRTASISAVGGKAIGA